MIEIQSLCAGYGNHRILHSFSALLKNKRLIAVIGPNGSGKSTLLKALTGILVPTDGHVLVDSLPLSQLSPAESAKRIAYLPQGRTPPEMTVSQLVLHGRFAHLRYPRVYTQEDKDAAQKAMEEMGLLAYAETPLSALSGGMRQNAYVAMTLAQGSPHILLDEPTTYLDVGNRLQLMRKLQTLAHDGKCIVAVLHDLTLAMRFADEIIVMQNGNLIAQDTPEQIYRQGVIDTTFEICLQRISLQNGYAYYLGGTE